MLIGCPCKTLKECSHSRKIGGYVRKSITVGHGDLWCAESLDSIDRKCRGQAAIPYFDPRTTISIHPASFPTAVFLLECEEGPKVHIVTDAGRCASEDTHSKNQSISLGSNYLSNPLTKNRTKRKVGFSPFDPVEETTHEEQETFGSHIITSAIYVPPVDQDVLDPCEGIRELVTTAVGIEEGQGVHADDWIEMQSCVVKIGLAKRVHEGRDDSEEENKRLT